MTPLGGPTTLGPVHDMQALASNPVGDQCPSRPRTSRTRQMAPSRACVREVEDIIDGVKQEWLGQVSREVTVAIGLTKQSSINGNPVAIAGTVDNIAAAVRDKSDYKVVSIISQVQMRMSSFQGVSGSEQVRVCPWSVHSVVPS